jgi:putative RNase toxin 44 of polymorphic toxin system
MDERPKCAERERRRYIVDHATSSTGLDQRKFGVNGKINRDYIDFGNYNYGVVAAAAGYSWEYATTASGLANLLGSGKKSLQDKFNNPDNLKMMRQGFDDYRAGKMVPLKN